MCGVMLRKSLRRARAHVRVRLRVRASYEARVTFETGPAQISVDYVFSDNELLVTEFSVLSGALSR